MEPIVNIAISAARRAGSILLRSMDRIESLRIEVKGRNDFVSDVDRQCEQVIIETIRKAHPDHSILAEESGRQDRESEFEWIVDPLDGTTNYLHGFPAFAISIAVTEAGKLAHGVIYDPLREELYTASRGRGALLNGRRIRVSQRRRLRNALIGTGFPFRDFTDLDGYLGMLRAVLQNSGGVRRAGAAALDLAWVASGRLDGFFELGLKPWDIAAGCLLIEEAGGIVGRIAGEAGYPIADGHIVAATPSVHEALIGALEPVLPPTLKRL